MNAIIALLTLAVSLLTQVQSDPNLPLATQQEAISVATLAVQLAQQYASTTATTSITSSNSSVPGNNQIGTGDSSPSPIVEENPVNSAPNFVGTPQEVVVPIEGDQLDNVTLSWQTDILATADFKWCNNPASCGTVNKTFPVASTTQAYYLPYRPQGTFNYYMITIYANGLQNQYTGLLSQ